MTSSSEEDLFDFESFSEDLQSPHNESTTTSQSSYGYNWDDLEEDYWIRIDNALVPFIDNNDNWTDIEDSSDTSEMEDGSDDSAWWTDIEDSSDTSEMEDGSDDSTWIDDETHERSFRLTDIQYIGESSFRDDPDYLENANAYHTQSMQKKAAADAVIPKYNKFVITQDGTPALRDFAKHINDNCTVCLLQLSPYTDNQPRKENLIITGCNHYFHRHCIKGVLYSNRQTDYKRATGALPLYLYPAKCPNCRAKLTQYATNVRSDTNFEIRTFRENNYL